MSPATSGRPKSVLRKASPEPESRRLRCAGASTTRRAGLASAGGISTRAPREAAARAPWRARVGGALPAALADAPLAHLQAWDGEPRGALADVLRFGGRHLQADRALV